MAGARFFKSDLQMQTPVDRINWTGSESLSGARLGDVVRVFEHRVQHETTGVDIARRRWRRKGLAVGHCREAAPT